MALPVVREFLLRRLLLPRLLHHGLRQPPEALIKQEEALTGQHTLAAGGAFTTNESIFAYPATAWNFQFRVVSGCTVDI